ncbi:MAG: glutamine-hydrolyzing carbamoyl-phosphate synthase small subunit [Candidatus Tectomicrobia bacterium]|uniref:Carbamoyl phosphate synthase small chain n=1 Tax=Tectimicrobiota bacterium TaxID=2528274 RepID=A0A933GKH2_UNCTE|nr:glutamine-hydrolyzing carbamoyl-phosphate synthase small subunit [Candidatus Tectomicrobia bacterium]
MKALLALADGKIFTGESFGACGETIGEVVFNTSMTGYQEILTDPSYCGQIVVMTYPLIGNYGVNEEDVESPKPQVEGFIVREASLLSSNWRRQKDLTQFLKDFNIVGIQDIDTRALTKHIRTVGAQQGVISSLDLDPQSLIAKAKAAPGMEGLDLVRKVTSRDKYLWTQGEWELDEGYTLKGFNERSQTGFFIVALDFGIKHNILRKLTRFSHKVLILPAQATAEEVLEMKPDAVFLSNGPGDPAAVPYAIKTVKRLLGQKPIFGICLGHQILALALGAKTYKLKFGHRGGNQPVMDLTTNKIEITAQNHGFAVDSETLPPGTRVTHINLNDRTVEGMENPELGFFSVQYHPEASPGPHDTDYLFSRFRKLIENHKGENSCPNEGI